MGELVIAIGERGKVQAMHSDKFSLSFLGGLKITRQSDIKFNEESQLWDIHYVTTEGKLCTAEALQGFGTYESARDFEVRWLNDCLLVGIYPLSAEGICAASMLSEVTQ